MLRYGVEMGDLAKDKASAGHQAAGNAPQVELILRDELARGDRALSGVTPVLSHLLADTGHSLVSDAIVARLRGILTDLSAQLLAASRAINEPVGAEHIDRFAVELGEDGAVLSHCYAIAMEGHLTERLEQRAQIDPVLAPLLQELIASERPETGELAMSCMAAQARFVQTQRRMQMPLSELPAELFHAVVRRYESYCNRFEIPVSRDVMSELKSGFDEGASRLGLLGRLVAAMRGGAQAAFNLDHAGLALFATALGAKTRQPRELAILACHERQAARLALTLRAAGLDEAAIERQFLIVEPSERTPTGLDEVSPQRALAMLNRSDTITAA